MTAVLSPIFQGLSLLFEILAMLVFFNTLLSWISPMGRIREMTSTLCEPLIAPFRALLSKMIKSYMPVDFSPTLAMMALFILASVFSGWAMRL